MNSSTIEPKSVAGNYLAIRESWLALHSEPVMEPNLPIVDAHHHFYDRPGWTYLEEEYLADVQTGHNIQASVYVQAQTRYRPERPEHMQPVGETEFVVASTRQRGKNSSNLVAGIVGHANLRSGSKVREILEAHISAGEGRFRGIRHLTTWDADKSLTNPLSVVPQGLMQDAAYRQGVAQLAPLGLSYDAWLFFHQLPELMALAKEFPQTPIIINHCGGVVRIGGYAAQQHEVFRTWAMHMRELAQLPNIHIKLGGLGMRINGFGFEQATLPPTSEQLAHTWTPWIETCIEAFGADRCMFESNFPVDKGSYAFATGWNAFKRITSGASPSERQALFADTAKRVYRLA